MTAGTRWFCGVGGAGYGVVYNAHYFVLIYYSQVLKLDAGLFGTVVISVSVLWFSLGLRRFIPRLR